MPLQEEWEQTGNWLFKRRSWLPLLLFFLALIVLLYYRFSELQLKTTIYWEVFCLAISIFGWLIRVYTVGHTPSGTSGRNREEQVADELNTTGIYSLVRHPLYLGNFLMWFGLMLLFGIWWFALLGVLIFWLYYEKIMYAEEQFLRKMYGEQYIQWASGLPAFIPCFSGFRPNKHPFSFKKILRREIAGLLAMVVSFYFLLVAASFILNNEWMLEKFWQILLLSVLVFYLITRFLKKKTQLLKLET